MPAGRPAGDASHNAPAMVPIMGISGTASLPLAADTLRDLPRGVFPRIIIFDHGFELGMTRELPDLPDVVAVFQRGRDRRVTKPVGAERPGELRPAPEPVGEQR